MIQTDVLVVGSGIAGLSFAIKVAEQRPDLSVLIITKAGKEESNTKYAQGGIATVLNTVTDSFEKHIQDTLIAGDGKCDESVVRMVVEKAPERIRELINWGVQFDKNKQGLFDLGKEGGHSENRILHHKDITGFEIERALIQKVKSISNIKILENHFSIDLITQHQLGAEYNKENITCFGAYILNQLTGKVSTVSSKITMLATGGIGQVYQNTTNPIIATGDGIAMAYRAKAQIKDMEFIQFHPTALYNPGESPSFLISEAVRGAGAILRNRSGEAFMSKYDERKDLAPRDIVARAIDSELKNRGEDFVYLDCTHINYSEFVHHFPNITDKCKTLGIDISKNYIPVVPAQHYLCGGVVVNKNGETSVANLYASGECSRTGLHGANRLASNSLLEALVFSHQSSLHVLKKVDGIKRQDEIPLWNDSGVIINNEKVLIKHNLEEVKMLMNDYVGIVRSNLRLRRARARHSLIYEENKKLYDNSRLTVDLCELRNIISTSHLIIKACEQQKENRGGFYNVDLE